jgi:antirestriction protein ArdC
MPDRITRTETNDKGEECEREIPFMKGYTVFNAEQCEKLPAHYTAKAEPLPSPRCSASQRSTAAGVRRTQAPPRRKATRAPASAFQQFYRHPESKHEIASVWSYRHRCHGRDAGNGANDNPHLR